MKAALLLLAATLAAPHAEAGSEEGAVRALVQQMMDGWAAGRGDAFAAPFTEDADYITFGGDHLKGRAAIVAAHQKLFERAKGSRLQARVTSVRSLSPGVLVAHGTGGVLWPGQTELGPERKSIQTYVVARRDGRWRITAFHNTRIQPEQGRGPK